MFVRALQRYPEKLQCPQGQCPQGPSVELLLNGHRSSDALCFSVRARPCCSRALVAAAPVLQPRPCCSRALQRYPEKLQCLQGQCPQGQAVKLLLNDSPIRTFAHLALSSIALHKYSPTLPF